MNFLDARYMFHNHIYGLSEKNRVNRIQRMQQMLREQRVDFAIFCGKGFAGFGAWFTGLPNPEFPDAENGGFILPARGDLVDVGGNALVTEEYLKNMKTLDVITPPYVEVEHMSGMPGFSGDQMRALLGENRRIGLVNAERMRATLSDYLDAELPGCERVDLTEQALEVLAVKSDEELEAMRLVAKTHDRAFSVLPLVLQEGKTERDAVVKLRRSLLDFGAAGQEITHIMPVALTSAQQGANAEKTPVAYPGRRFQDGDRINVATIAATYSDYRAGLGRCFVLGEAQKETKQMWNAAVAAQNAAAKMICDGASVGDVWTAAEAAFAACGADAAFSCRLYEVGYEARLMTEPKEVLREKTTLVLAACVCPDGQDEYCCMDTYAVTSGKCQRFTQTQQDIIELKNF